MFAFHTTRSNARRLSADEPIGDPFSYGKTNDVGSVVGAVAGPIIGGIFGESASDSQAAATQSAANTSAAAAKYAADIQKEMYDQTRTDQTPWRDAGKNALAQMVTGMGTTGMNGDLTRSFTMGDYSADPGYAFRMAEGEKALERSAAARGGLYSGRAMKDMARFSQGLASDEYQNAFNRFNTNQTSKFNRLASLAGLGQTANTALGQAGQNYANSVGTIGMTNASNQAGAALAGGNARASAYEGWGKALGGVNWGNLFGGGGGGSYYNPANEGIGGMSAQYIQGGF